MPTETVFVREADSRSGTGKNGKAYTLWTITTGDGRQLKTFQSGPGEAAKSFVGAYADVDLEVSENGQYTDYKLLAIRPSSEQPSSPPTPTPAAATGGGEKGGGVSLDKLDACKAAFGFGTYALGLTKTASDRDELESYLFGLAERIERWAHDRPVGAQGVRIPDDDIPF